MTHWIEADDFSVAEAVRLKRVKFWDFEIPNGFAGSIVWQIYSNSSSDSPGTLLYSGTAVNPSHVPTGLKVYGLFHEFIIEFDMDSISLPAGIYWLGLHNGPLSNSTSSISFYWETTDQLGVRPSRGKTAPYNGPWFSNVYPGFPSEFAFQINGVSIPRITRLEFDDGTPRVSFTTTAGEGYRVEYKNSLADQAWTPLSGAEFVLGTGTVIQVGDVDPAVRNLAHRFYRVVLL